MAKTISFDWTIQILPTEINTDFKLTIAIEAPQIGSSTVGKPDGDYLTGQVNDESIGLGGFLKGKTCYISTMVTDFSETTNATIVHYQLNSHKIDFNESANENHGSVIYKIRIKFQ